MCVMAMTHEEIVLRLTCFLIYGTKLYKSKYVHININKKDRYKLKEDYRIIIFVTYKIVDIVMIQ